MEKFDLYLEKVNEIANMTEELFDVDVIYTPVDGEIVFCKWGGGKCWLCIVKGMPECGFEIDTYCGVFLDAEEELWFNKHLEAQDICRPATAQEKGFLYVKLAEKGLRWNNKKKRVEEAQCWLLNAFSLQMLGNGDINFLKSDIEALPEGLKSAVGHPDTAAVLGVEYNRTNVSLRSGDVAYIAQLTGGRLPEGATTLPVGFSFKYIRIIVI